MKTKPLKTPTYKYESKKSSKEAAETKKATFEFRIGEKTCVDFQRERSSPKEQRQAHFTEALWG